jgi:hypothetical protein
MARRPGPRFRNTAKQHATPQASTRKRRVGKLPLPLHPLPFALDAPGAGLDEGVLSGPRSTATPPTAGVPSGYADISYTDVPAPQPDTTFGFAEAGDSAGFGAPFGSTFGPPTSSQSVEPDPVAGFAPSLPTGFAPDEPTGFVPGQVALKGEGVLVAGGPLGAQPVAAAAETPLPLRVPFVGEMHPQADVPDASKTFTPTKAARDQADHKSAVGNSRKPL